MATQTKGLCKYCGKECTKGGMIRHLASCKKRQAKIETEKGKRKCGYFQIIITAKYSKEYWLIVEASENVTLNELDKFIRDIWVECCQHLSAYEINGISYEKYPSDDYMWGTSAKNMNYRLRDVVKVGDNMSYEYDFGSTTELILNVHSYREGVRKDDGIVILSRNNPIEIICSHCGQNKAEWVNSEEYYDYDGEPFWCEECLRAESDTEDDEDFYGEEFLLPVCNSPRMGVCGYEGSKKYPDQFESDKEV